MLEGNTSGRGLLLLLLLWGGNNWGGREQLWEGNGDSDWIWSRGFVYGLQESLVRAISTDSDLVLA